MVHRLTLAHSPDPDDVFMWWPLTGKIIPEGSGCRVIEPPSLPGLASSRFAFDPLPADIEVLNRRAASDDAAARLDITALSLRCWASVRDRFTLTRSGGSFGDGFGPKLVVAAAHPATHAADLRPADRVAIPGFRTTAHLMLTKVLGLPSEPDPARFIEMPFDQIIPAVASGRADAGLVIHEGQLTYADAGLRLLVDVGAWWKERTGLKLPLGVNAMRSDLDARLWPGASREIADLLAASVRHAAERRDESTAATMPWAAANARKAGMDPPTLGRVDRYCRMYVSDETLDMTLGGPRSGLAAVRRLLADDSITCV
jgi:1,4-dihydroxy-6-naphthoate synthase